MGGSDSAFARALGDLKRRGSSLLVVGSPTGGAHAAACDRLRGSSDADDRSRIRVVTDGASCGTTSDGSRVLTHPTPTRSAAAASTGPSAAGTAAGADDPDLGDLAAAVDREIAAADATTAGELRLCLDSLLALLETYDPAEVDRFLHAVGNRVRSERGMAHAHLPLERNADAVARIEPGFDAVIDLRVVDGEPQQRWHVRDPDLDSGWLALDS